MSGRERDRSLKNCSFPSKKSEDLKRTSRMVRFIRDTCIVSSVSRGNQYDEGNFKDMSTR